jgi:hypothetical protein
MDGVGRSFHPAPEGADVTARRRLIERPFEAILHRRPLSGVPDVICVEKVTAQRCVIDARRDRIERILDLRD